MSVPDLTESFLTLSSATFSTWHGRIEKCLDQLTPDQIWWRGQENSNAIGNLVLHLCGNVRQWILSGVGNASDIRNRPAEFAQRETLPTEELRTRLAEIVREASQVISRLTEEDLKQRRSIQGYDVTVLEAVHHVTEHFAMHAGQILYATKLLTGTDLGFFRHLDPQQKKD